MAASGYVAAIDFGGTKISAAVGAHGEVGFLGRTQASTPATAQESIELALGLTDRLLASQQAHAVAVGISFGGHVDVRRARIHRSLHVPGWEDVPLGDIVSRHFGAPCTVVNDGDAGAVGEWRRGAARGRSSIVFLTVGTGVGGGLLVDGQLYAGGGFAGEFGHMPVGAEHQICTCGAIGCLEAVASGPAVVRNAVQKLTAGGQSSLSAESDLTGMTVARHARSGDPLAKQVLQEAGTGLGVVLRALTCAIDPEVIVIGGGVAKSPEPFWAGVSRAAVPPTFRGPADIVRAEHMDDAPLVGAMVLASEDRYIGRDRTWRRCGGWRW